MFVEISKSALLLFMLLNPFLMIVYLMDVVKELDSGVFASVLYRAGIVSAIVFSIFAMTGEAFFQHVLQARFESLQIFGGIVFLIIGLQFVFTGKTAIVQLRGEAKRLFGVITMPLMIGPGSISASILIGSKLNSIQSVAAILLAVSLSVLTLLLLKRLHDYVIPRREPLVERYVEIMGRVTALVVGTFAIEMIMRGLQAWWPQTCV